ncbi:flagellar biosynthesis regulator FlaF [Frigidibacter sp. RF13]|uniref:flagellar biosynthesis regulator FlaF n=1 Tax=Frigidibacter sp. RF13 TaxID=2997340 RepID=UPI00227008D4|nr:flagellar biosynthesis regulator FlaF [Frigidibacter sp. RF13]MCY1128708.1 flagellar biosynthesis regulator FlaF [Frigidibacter sp. RF13]
MTAQIMARAAYASPTAATRSPRSIEYDAFARVTHQLKAALAAPKANFAALARALHDNRALWTVLAADVAEAANGLPEALRAKLFYLAEFTVDHSRKVLAGQADVGVLVEINTAVMRGLRREEDRG